MPMLNEQVIADNLALIERNRELECELAALKTRLDAVSRIADELHENAAKEDARLCAFKFWLACELRDAIW